MPQRGALESGSTIVFGAGARRAAGLAAAPVRAAGAALRRGKAGSGETSMSKRGITAALALAGRKTTCGLCGALLSLPTSMLLRPGPACAGAGQPSPMQIGFQDAVTPVAEDIHWVHDYVNAIIFVITAFVLALLLYVIWRFG